MGVEQIKVIKATGQYAISGEVGQKVYEQIFPKLRGGHQVTLDFSGVRCFVAAFFHFSIGQLLKDFSPEFLNQQLAFVGLPQHAEKTLNAVIDTAKKYYKTPCPN